MPKPPTSSCSWARRVAFYTLSAASLPGGRGLGEPVRLMVDLPNEAEIVDLFVHQPGTRD
jgi:topoisomerase-4 subunit A